MAGDFSRSSSARHVAREYARAKKMGVTQKEFAANAGISSPRYLRKILKGERSGRILEERASHGGAFTVPIQFGETTGGMNVRLPSGVSRFDVYQQKIQKRIRLAVTKAQREERTAAKDISKLNDTNLARIRGKIQSGRLRFARRVRAMPREVLS